MSPPLGGGIYTRRLATLSINNTLLAKKPVFERGKRISNRTLGRLRQMGMEEILIYRLQKLQGREFPNAASLEEALITLFQDQPSQLIDQVISQAERGVLARSTNISLITAKGGPSRIIAIHVIH